MYFDGSPFALTADPKTAALWAGRPNELRRIERLTRLLSNRSDSTLDLIWANFGAGKSHALFHLSYLVAQSGANAIPVFVEVPEQFRHFVDFYRRIVASLPWSKIATLLATSESVSSNIDLRRAIQVIAHGDHADRLIALDWLTAGRPAIRELRAITGISNRIEDDVRATDMLADIIRGLAQYRRRVLILFDEFQRLNVAQERQRTAILSSIRTLFSRNPTCLSVVLAATTRVEKSALEILPQELRTLMGMRPAIGLPEMSEDEAFDFAIDRFAFFRPSGFTGSAASPLSDDVIRACIQFIAQKPYASLIPRTLLQALASLCDETEISGKALSADEARALLGELSWDGASVSAGGAG